MNKRKSLNSMVILIAVLLLSTLACTAVTRNADNINTDNTDKPIPVCTPPLCARNETFECDGDCPGGCGTYCAMFTPAPHPMYPAVTLAAVNLSVDVLDISVDVPGIEGEFYGVVAGENFECRLSQADSFPERLTCTGNLWFTEGTQTLRAYRTSDDQQAFNLDFTIPDH